MHESMVYASQYKKHQPRIFLCSLFPSGEAVGFTGSSVHEAQAGWPLAPTEPLCKQHEQTHGQKSASLKFRVN